VIRAQVPAGRSYQGGKDCPRAQVGPQPDEQDDPVHRRRKQARGGLRCAPGQNPGSARKTLFGRRRRRERKQRTRVWRTRVQVRITNFCLSLLLKRYFSICIYVSGQAPFLAHYISTCLCLLLVERNACHLVLPQHRYSIHGCYTI
jgi:hypothetical protein